MRVVLLRVGIDSGRGGMQGPLFKDGTFEFVPINDNLHVSKNTYGNTRGKKGRKLFKYFPPNRQKKMFGVPIHDDPEFKTFTYGDPKPSKQSLKGLNRGDLLVFYAGLQGRDVRPKRKPALYIIGYFVVEHAGLAKVLEKKLGARRIQHIFRRNFHVRHTKVFQKQKRGKLILVRGGRGSRLLKKAQVISSMGKDKLGRPLKVLDKRMKNYFGSFGGKNSLQRSNPRWVPADHVRKAAKFVRKLR